MSDLEALKRKHPEWCWKCGFPSGCYIHEGVPGWIPSCADEGVESPVIAALVALVQQHEATIAELTTQRDECGRLAAEEAIKVSNLRLELAAAQAELAKAQETIQQQARKLEEAKKLLKAANSKGSDCSVHGPVTSNPCIWCRFDDGEQMDQLVRRMAERFCGWKLPEDFAPDAGISFKREFNEHTPWPSKHEPTGTNLFTMIQAEAMIRFLLDPESARSQQAEAKREE